MNNAVTKLYSCCLDNRVLIIETNFKQFYKILKNIEPSCNSDRWYANKFKESQEFKHVINDKEYFFQQLV